MIEEVRSNNLGLIGQKQKPIERRKTKRLLTVRMSLLRFLLSFAASNRISLQGRVKNLAEAFYRVRGLLQGDVTAPFCLIKYKPPFCLIELDGQDGLTRHSPDTDQGNKHLTRVGSCPNERAAFLLVVSRWALPANNKINKDGCDMSHITLDLTYYCSPIIT